MELSCYKLEKTAEDELSVYKQNKEVPKGPNKIRNQVRKLVIKMVVLMKEEETRKGPWTEQEDLQLVCFVSLFGERRWDFIAKVSGLRGAGLAR